MSKLDYTHITTRPYDGIILSEVAALESLIAASDEQTKTLTTASLHEDGSTEQRESLLVFESLSGIPVLESSDDKDDDKKDSGEKKSNIFVRVLKGIWKALTWPFRKMLDMFKKFFNWLMSRTSDDEKKIMKKAGLIEEAVKFEIKFQPSEEHIKTLQDAKEMAQAMAKGSNGLSKAEEITKELKAKQEALLKKVEESLSQVADKVYPHRSMYPIEQWLDPITEQDIKDVQEKIEVRLILENTLMETLCHGSDIPEPFWGEGISLLQDTKFKQILLRATKMRNAELEVTNALYEMVDADRFGGWVKKYCNEKAIEKDDVQVTDMFNELMELMPTMKDYGNTEFEQAGYVAKQDNTNPILTHVTPEGAGPGFYISLLTEKPTMASILRANGNGRANEWATLLGNSKFEGENPETALGHMAKLIASFEESVVHKSSFFYSKDGWNNKGDDKKKETKAPPRNAGSIIFHLRHFQEAIDEGWIVGMSEDTTEQFIKSHEDALKSIRDRANVNKNTIDELTSIVEHYADADMSKLSKHALLKQRLLSAFCNYYKRLFGLYMNIVSFLRKDMNITVLMQDKFYRCLAWTNKTLSSAQCKGDLEAALKLGANGYFVGSQHVTIELEPMLKARRDNKEAAKQHKANPDKANPASEDSINKQVDKVMSDLADPNVKTVNF